MFLFKRNLNDAIELASLVSSDKLFHARIVAGKKRVIKLIRISVNSLDVVCISKVVSSSLLYQRRNKIREILGSK